MAITTLVYWVPGVRRSLSQDDIIDDVNTGGRDLLSGVRSLSADRCIRLLADLAEYDPADPRSAERWRAAANALFNPDKFHAIVNRMIDLAIVYYMIHVSGDRDGTLHRMMNDVRVSAAILIARP